MINFTVVGIIKVMRPKHYLKNGLIFTSLVFTGNLFDLSTLLVVICGFVAFSLLASVVYIINDIRDVQEDRQHEIKKHRPIASGVVSMPVAITTAICLFFLAIGINIIFIGIDWNSNSLLLTYFLINLGYSIGLKNKPFIDIALLVSGFLLRVLYGAAIIQSGVSHWVYLTVMMLSFYFALGKRRNELKKNNTALTTRKVLQYYNYDFLDKFMYMCLTLAIAFYSLWSTASGTVAKYGTDLLVWTVPMVVIVVMKYSADVESDSYGDPVDIILHDKVLMVLSGIFAVVLLFLLYFQNFLV